MGISIRSHLYSNAVIAAKFCTWHDSCAVVACAKICCDPMASNRVMARRSFHRIWIAGKKALVKRAPDQLSREYFHLSPATMWFAKKLWLLRDNRAVFISKHFAAFQSMMKRIRKSCNLHQWVEPVIRVWSSDVFIDIWSTKSKADSERPK